MAPSPSATSSLSCNTIDGDDLTCLREGGTHHDREPDAAEPDHGDAGPRWHLGRLEDGAHARRDAAADERGDGRVDAIGEGDGGRDGHHRRLGHRADAAIREDRLAAVRGEDRRAVRHPVAERRGVGARPRPARPARSAPTAWHQPGQRDRLARHAATARPARPPRRRRRPRGPSRSVSVAATHRRERGGRSGRRRTQGSGPGPRLHAARRARPSRRRSDSRPGAGRRPRLWSRHDCHHRGDLDQRGMGHAAPDRTVRGRTLPKDSRRRGSLAPSPGRAYGLSGRRRTIATDSKFR